MRVEHLKLFRCPACRRQLRLDANCGEEQVIEGGLSCSSGHRWRVDDGIADLVHPAKLLPSDEEFLKKYDCGADQYDKGLEWLFRSFFEDEDLVREEMVDLLELKPGSTVLDVGCGTGSDSTHIAERLEQSGTLFMLDLSLGMLQRARQKMDATRKQRHAETQEEGPSLDYMLSNGAYLPFADRTFDAVFHFGGINEFGEIRRALAEMTRVTRVGGKVVVGDEGVAPWLRRKTFGRILTTANPLYKHRPPVDALPVDAREVVLRWILGNAFYVIDFRVGEGLPPVDLDLPIPGKGDSLRSRYYGPKR